MPTGDNMKNFTKETVYNYVFGNEVVGYDIDELENNPKFMREVIKVTRDKRMYNLCGDDVKNNKEFVEFLIEIFNDDLDFLIKVVDKFSDNNEKVDILEVYILLDKLAKDRFDDRLFSYKTATYLSYLSKKSLYEISINNEQNKKWKKRFGLGFCFVLLNYSYSQIIKNYFAEKMVDSILVDEKFEDLETGFHRRYRSVDEIKDEGINASIINFVEKYDCDLAGYLSNNIELLKNARRRVERIIRRWDFYNARKDDLLIENVINNIVSFVDESNLMIEYGEIIGYIIREFKLNDKYLNYEKRNFKTDEENIVLGTVDLEQLDFRDQLLINQLKGRIKRVINNTDEDDYTIDEKVKTKVFNIGKRKYN